MFSYINRDIGGFLFFYLGPIKEILFREALWSSLFLLLFGFDIRTFVLSF